MKNSEKHPSSSFGHNDFRKDEKQPCRTNWARFGPV
jgi:hypothetical protein